MSAADLESKVLLLNKAMSPPVFDLFRRARFSF